LDAELSRSDGLPVRQAELVHSYGLRPGLLAVTQIWKAPGKDGYTVAVKGAPEAIAALCGFSDEALTVLPRVVGRIAGDGMRVLAVAEAHFEGHEWPDSPRGFEFNFLGLAGLADPLRPSVPEAMRECRSAGIRVVMITGDHPQTALAIAQKAGIPASSVLTGGDIEGMDDRELRRTTASACVFARVMPGQKLRIIRALKANGEVVAMTGDGVNDAPSLKAADIGIAMGGRGTDVAREASALVLLDDDFGSIVRTVRLGRRIYDNLRKAMGYILALHVPIAGLALLPLLTGLPLVLLPIHIAFLEMVIDPICAVVFEAEKEEKDIMRRPPRRAASRLFSRGIVLWGLIQGALAFAIVAALYLEAIRLGLPENDVRAVTFVALVLVNFGLVLVNRSFESSLGEALRRGNPALWWVSAITAVLLGLALVFEPARRLFRFGQLHSDDLLAALASAMALILAAEFLKRYWRGRLTA
ncbi:MAG: cation-translocating P-type ATPase, partial [Beijerinckiaceae bacterium]|nr:cation-translocating P-type ATPase [Beijerinckiaceae bacterium]